jgi:protoheme IX farnesyltransferase
VLAYVALTKPRVIELLLVTTIPAMLLAHRGTVDPLLIANTLFGGIWRPRAPTPELRGRRRHRQGDEAHRAAAAGHRDGAAHARPDLRAGAVGQLVLLVVVDDEHAVGAPGGLTIGFYVFIYTLLLKRRTPQNVVWGGAAAACPS